MELYCVYEHVFPDGKRYIGLSKCPAEKRWHSDGSGYISNKPMYKAIEKYGWENIEHNIIADGVSRVEAQQIEREMIDKYDTIKTGFNQRPGGTAGGCLYSKHVMKMIRSMKTYWYLNKDFRNMASEMMKLANDECWAYQVNLVDYVIREECDGFKYGIHYRHGEPSWEVIDWYYYIGHWVMEPEVDIRTIDPPQTNIERFFQDYYPTGGVEQ
ncbi:MAG: hypothetical protein IKF39_11325 [Oscillospiraceae bacterium]|nr:hypothetical protein [Oscillospiraceae bacterium]